MSQLRGKERGAKKWLCLFPKGMEDYCPSSSPVSRLKPEAVTVQYVASSAVGTVVAFLLSSPCCTEENRLQLEA
jgi:hypothetical protein